MQTSEYNKPEAKNYKFETNSSYETKQEPEKSYTPTSAKLKTSYSQNGLGNALTQNTKSLNSNDYSTKENFHSTNSQKCSCGCADQLIKANLKIESLEKKIKLLMEENKILKYLASDPKEKEVKHELNSNNSNNHLNHHTKSVFEKSINQQEFMTTPDTYDDGADIPEKQIVPSLAEKSRSMSVDTYAKRKGLTDITDKNNGSMNKENQGPSEHKKDIKKMIPRLRLEMLPNYHGNQAGNGKQTQIPPQQNVSTNSTLATNQSLSFSKNGTGSTSQVQTLSKGPLQQSLTNSIQNMNVNSLMYSQSNLSGTSLSKYIKK